MEMEITRNKRYCVKNYCYLNLTFLSDTNLRVTERVMVFVVEVKNINMLKEQLVIGISHIDDNTCKKKLGNIKVLIKKGK